MTVKTTSREGFTIVELVIVIVVIGILAAITIVAYTGVSARANDARRLSDSEMIINALKLHRLELGQFPLPTSVNGSWEMSSEDSPEDFIEALKNEGFIDTVPVDPINTGTTTYYYYRYGAGGAGCDPSDGAYYVFAINDLESVNGVSPQSPGWSCPNRDWQDEFDWVTGGFES